MTETLTTNQKLYAELRKLAYEMVCPVNQNLAHGFVAGAYEGWGWARVYIQRLLNQYPIPPERGVPDDAACFFKDGNAWCCVRGDFTNLQESPAGFGETMDVALSDLHRQVTS